MPYPTFAAGQTLTAAMLTALQWKEVYQGSDQTRTSSTALTASSIVIPVVAGATYRYKLLVRYSTSGVNPDIKFDWTVPTNASMQRFVQGPGQVLVATAASGAANQITTLTSTHVAHSTVLDFHANAVQSGMAGHFQEDGEIYGGDGGNVTLRFAQAASDAQTTTLHAETVAYYQRIA